MAKPQAHAKRKAEASKEAYACRHRPQPQERKLPSAKEVARLYFIENLTGTAIAKMFHCSPASVYSKLQLAGHKRRPTGMRYLTGKCVQCHREVAILKAWSQKLKKYIFRSAARCRIHQVEFMRRLNRDWKRRNRGVQKPRGPYKKGIPESDWIL